MAFRLPNAGDLLQLPAQGVQALSEAVALLPRVTALIGDAELLVRRVQRVIDEIETVRQRADEAVDRVIETQREARQVVVRSDAVVSQAAQIAARIEPLLDRFEPVLDKLAPIAAELVNTTSPDEVNAVVRMINATPDLADKLQRDILPVLDTLGTVAPDVRDLLDLVKEVSEMLGSIPGLGRIKKRIEKEQEVEDEYRADEEPPASPDRNGATPLGR